MLNLLVDIFEHFFKHLFKEQSINNNLFIQPIIMAKQQHTYLFWLSLVPFSHCCFSSIFLIQINDGQHKSGNSCLSVEMAVCWICFFAFTVKYHIFSAKSIDINYIYTMPNCSCVYARCSYCNTIGSPILCFRKIQTNIFYFGGLC